MCAIAISLLAGEKQKVVRENKVLKLETSQVVDAIHFDQERKKFLKEIYCKLSYYIIYLI